MTVNDDLGYAEISRIFAERDRRASINGTAARKLEEQTPQKRQRRETTSAARQMGQYERTPQRDEFKPARRKPPQKSKGGKHLAKNIQTQRYSTENRPKNVGKKLSPEAKVALLLSALGSIGAATGAYLANTNNNTDTIMQNEAFPSAIVGYTDLSQNYDIFQTGDNEFVIVDNTQNGTIATDEDITDEGITVYGDIEEIEEEPIKYCSMDYVTDRVIESIKEWEGFKNEAYLCPGDKWTIGCGHTEGVYEGQVITDEQGAEFLRNDLKTAMGAVRRYCNEIGLELTQSQFDALVSFTYNCGSGSFGQSGIAEALLVDDIDKASDIMNQYITAKGKVMNGLVERRAVESSWLYE